MFCHLRKIINIKEFGAHVVVSLLINIVAMGTYRVGLDASFTRPSFIDNA